ncbi:MAG: DUF4381 domain-containing protein [Gammaproteobacteria bacterium]
MYPEHTTLPLRDIHLPEAVSWWPLAPGWWLLLVVLMIAGTLSFYLLRLKAKRRLYKQASMQLDSLIRRYQKNQDAQWLVKELSILLRRVCISHYSRRDVASLTGNTWLKFLDQPLLENETGLRFSTDGGRALLSAPYQSHCTIDVDNLLLLSRTWLKALQKSGRGQ